MGSGLEPSTHAPEIAAASRPVQTPEGRRIVDESFATIDREAGEHGFASDAWTVVRRMIHTTADFEFKDLTMFHSGALTAGVAALRRSCPIVVDVQMIRAGLSLERLQAFGNQVSCFVSDEDVLVEALCQHTTKAAIAMRKAHRLGLMDGGVIAVGNAPTALFEVLRLVQEDGARPALIVGVPVGFIAASESKEALVAQVATPFITTRGRKGGSPVAVAIVHSLLALAAAEE